MVPGGWMGLKRSMVIEPFAMMPDVAVYSICFLSLVLSVMGSRLNADFYHWGLMFANATPLKDV